MRKTGFEKHYASFSKIINSLVLLSILGIAVFAQSTANYVFTPSNTGSLEDMSSGTTNLLATGVNHDDDASSVTPIGFTFYFMGTGYTQFSANSNGQIRLGATAISGGAATHAAAGQALIVPLSGDNSVEPTGKLHYKLTGSSPNQILVVEWTGFRIPFSSVGGGTFTPSQMQALIYEDGKIEFKYGSMFNNSTSTVSRSIGFSSNNLINTVKSVTVAAAPTDSNAAAPTANTFALSAAVANLNSAADGSRWVYTFTPPGGQPAAPTTLTFTGVTSTAITANWIDSSTNESAFQVFRSTDGLNYSLVSTVASTSVGATGASYSFADTGLSPGTLYYYRIRAVNEGGPNSANLDGSQSTNPATDIACLPTGGDWTATTTWSGGVVPTASENAVITGCTVTINSTAPVANKVTVGTGGVLQYPTVAATAGTLTALNGVEVQSGGSFIAGSGTSTGNNLNIGGTTATANGLSNFLIDGTVDFDSGVAKVTTNFFGNQNASISGIGATAAFYSIIVNKGTTNATIQDVNRVITLNVPTTSSTRLTVTAGTFRINSASTLSPFCGSQTITAAAGRLWIANSGALVGSNGFGTGTCAGSPTFSGVLQVSDGEFRYGSGNNTMTVGSTITSGLVIGGPNTLSSEIRDNDDRRKGYDEKGNDAELASTATVRMLGAVSVTGNMTMTEGNLIIDPQATNSISGTTNILSITPCTTPCNIQVTGGTITIVDPPSGTATGRAINLSRSGTSVPPANFNMIGSTIVLGDGISTALGNASNGFQTTTYAGTGVVYLGNLTINGGNAAGRYARSASSSDFGTYINGTLTINTGSEYRVTVASTTTPDVAVNGTLINNGTLTATGRLYFGSGALGTATSNEPGSTVPVLVNNGVIQNASVSPTANFSRLIINATPGMTFPATNYTVSDILDFKNGVLTIPAANKLTALALVGATRTNGWLNGTYEKVFGTGTSTTTQLMPVGTSEGYSPVLLSNITFATNPTLSATAYNQTMPGIEASKSISRYWSLEGPGAGTLTTDLTFTYLASGDVNGNEADYRVWKRVGVNTPTDECGAPCVNTTNKTVTKTAVSSFSTWTAAEANAVQTTAANATITGRVLSNTGENLKNVKVVLQGGGLSAPITAVTNNFGVYNFENVPVGTTYIVTVHSKRYFFSQPSIVVNLQENVSDLDFVGQEQ